MQRRFMLLAVLTTALGLHAQPEAGTFSVIPRIGVSIMHMSHAAGLGFGTSGPFSTDSKSLSGLTAGASLQYQAAGRLALSVGAMYARQGTRFDDTDLTGQSAGHYTAYSDQRLCCDYLLVPVMAHVYVCKGLAVELGFQPGFLLSSRCKYRQQDVTISKEGNYEYGDFIEGEEPAGGDLCKSVDWTVPVGLSYEYENVVIDCRYHIGLSNVLKEVGGTKNRGFSLTVGYKFDIRH